MEKEETIKKLKKNLTKMQVSIQLYQCQELRERLKIGIEKTIMELEKLGVAVER